MTDKKQILGIIAIFIISAIITSCQSETGGFLEIINNTGRDIKIRAKYKNTVYAKYNDGKMFEFVVYLSANESKICQINNDDIVTIEAYSLDEDRIPFFMGHVSVSGGRTETIIVKPR
jgi:hypothetical protein